MISIITPHGINYAAVRLWGSLGFGIVSITVGLITEHIGILKVFMLAPIAVLPLSLMVWSFKESDYCITPQLPRDEAKTQKINPTVLLKNYYFMTALIITLTLGVYMALTSSFYAYILEHAGINPEMIGLLSGYGSLLQVVCMWIFNRYCRNIPMPAILIAGGLFGVAENVMYGLAQNLGMMFIASTFWSVAVSARVSILPSYIHSLVPKEYAASAQTLNASVLMMLTIFGNLIGGYLIATIGITKYNYSVGALQLILVVIFALSIPFGKKVLKLARMRKFARAMAKNDRV
jgi:PPP family 3-phenylpropionic acid transporter